jgi:hypothetical protein
MALWSHTRDWSDAAMKIEQYDTVLLKDGRIGFVLEVNSATNFDMDVGASPADWKTLRSVSIDDIAMVIGKD